VILIPYTYFEWKLKVLLLLRRKGFYQITMGMKEKPNSMIDKAIFLTYWMKLSSYYACQYIKNYST
jgi:hypothetical protein